MKLLGEVVESGALAKTKMTNECNLEKGSAKTLENLAGGPARLEAAGKHAAAVKGCEDQTKVADALDNQHETQSAQCNKIKIKVEKQAAAFALKKANADAAAIAAKAAKAE